MAKFLKFAKQAIKCEAIEGITLYANEVTVHTTHNGYTAYYKNQDDAEKAYQEAIEKLELLLS